MEENDLEPRDVRALTEYLTVLGDQGYVRSAHDLYLVVSQSGFEYFVDTREGTCECPGHEYHGVYCKHACRGEFATGACLILAGGEDVDPQLGVHVSASPQAVVIDGE